jgi:molybdenum cofactor sulfurtransferase
MQHQVYLDYTGGSLYAESQLQKHLQMLSSGVFWQSAFRELVERTRRHVLEYFRARPGD